MSISHKYSFPMMFLIAFVRLWQMITMRYYRLRTPFLAWLWGVKHGRCLRFQGKTIIRTRHPEEIILGDDVVFNAQRSTNLVGLIGSTILDTIGGGRISVGDNSGFSAVVMSSRSSITIGNHVKVGGNVRIFDHDFHALEANFRRTAEDLKHIRSKPVTIEDDCFIGTNAIILKGSHLGARTIVAAGSVIFGLKVPPDSLVKGNPARIVSSIER